MKNIKLNDFVLIQITEEGWAHLSKEFGEDYINHCIRPYQVEYGGEIWYRMLLHSVITSFGGARFSSSHSPLKLKLLLYERD